MPKTALILAVLAALLSGCREPAAQTAPPASAAQGPQTPDSPDACKAANGRWEPGGMRRVPQCFREYADAGKPCDGPGQCQGLCLVVEGRGQCQATYPLFGCFQFFGPQGNRIGMCRD